MANDPDQGTSAVTISPEDRDTAIRTMIGEEPTAAGQAGVASVLLNRAQSGKFGTSVAGIARNPGQFESWSRNPKGLLDIPATDPRYQESAAIFDGVSSGKIPDMTGGATHFYAPVAQAALGRQPPKWASGQQGTSLGKSLFFAPNGPSNYKPAAASQAIQAATSDPFEDYPTTSAAPTTQPAKSADPFDEYPTTAVAASASIAAPAQADPFDDYPAAAATAPAQAPAPSGTDVYGQGLKAAASGVPIIGGLSNKIDAAAEAATAPLYNWLHPSNQQLTEPNFGDRYNEALNQNDASSQQFAQEHPTANNALSIGGGIVGTIPAAALAPEAFGISEAPMIGRMAAGAFTGSGIGAVDSAVRSGGDPSEALHGAEVGAATGAAGPVVGNALGAVGRKALDLFSGASAPARAVTNLLASAGLTPQDAQTALNRLGGSGTLADVDPALTTEAGALAARGGLTTSSVKNAMISREAGADDRMSQIVDQSLGPKPNTQQILNDIRSREISNTVDQSTAKAALDTSMGTPADPHAVLQRMIQDRSAAAQPLYAKALSNKVPFDTELARFVFNDPNAQEGLQRGIALQRNAAYAESLRTGQPTKFDPTLYDYTNGVIKGDNGQFQAAQYKMPNMQSMQAIKEGLDAMVQDAQDPVTGRLSKNGASMADLRDAFVQRLDTINPDYAAARQAWAGPSQAQDAFNRGLNIFRNQTGSSGVNTTPGALDTWFKGASDGEKEAVKLGARSAFQQQMASASDPASKAAALAGKQVNQQKLTSILGPNEAQKLTNQLTFKYEDPVGSAFSKGLDVFQNRGGLSGVEDTPDALKSWLKTASPAEKEAHQQGARQAIEQGLTSARQGDISAARGLFAKSTANRQKLEAVFPKAADMLDGLDNELRMRSTAQNLLGRSKTAEGAAAMQRWSPKAEPSGISNDLLAAGEGLAAAGPWGGVAAPLLRRGVGNLLSGVSQRASDKLAQGVAKSLVSTGPDQQAFMNQLTRAAATTRAHGLIQNGANAIGFAAAQGARNRLSHAQ